MMKVKVGDVVCSKFGRGPVVAITKEWLIHIDETHKEKSEVAVFLGDNSIWIPCESFLPGGGQDGESEAKESME